MHVIPSCEIPSFCATDASSHTGNARLEPHIGNAGESVSDILTEKSSHVATHVTLVRTSHVSTGYVGFFKNFSRIARRLRIGVARLCEETVP